MLRLLAACALIAAGSATAARAEEKKSIEDATFAKRLAALKAKQNIVVVKMSPGDDPMKVPPTAQTGMTLVANSRSGIYTPPLLEPGDIMAVVNEHMADVRKCYKKQLEDDPEWADELILDLAVKKTGRVAEVSIAPSRVKRDVIGQCLMSTIPKWKFPEFTGETDEGVTQEVVNASFPFSFSSN
jgi:hypothetical protein